MSYIVFCKAKIGFKPILGITKNAKLIAAAAIAKRILTTLKQYYF